MFPTYLYMSIHVCVGVCGCVCVCVCMFPTYVYMYIHVCVCVCVCVCFQHMCICPHMCLWVCVAWCDVRASRDCGQPHAWIFLLFQSRNYSPYHVLTRRDYHKAHFILLFQLLEVLKSPFYFRNVLKKVGLKKVVHTGLTLLRSATPHIPKLVGVVVADSVFLPVSVFHVLGQLEDKLPQDCE